MAVPPAPAPSVASVTSVDNDKGDNEMILGAIGGLLGYYIGPMLTQHRLSANVIYDTRRHSEIVFLIINAALYSEIVLKNPISPGLNERHNDGLNFKVDQNI